MRHRDSMAGIETLWLLSSGLVLSVPIMGSSQSCCRQDNNIISSTNSLCDKPEDPPRENHQKSVQGSPASDVWQKQQNNLNITDDVKEKPKTPDLRETSLGRSMEDTTVANKEEAVNGSAPEPIATEAEHPRPSDAISPGRDGETTPAETQRQEQGK